MRQTKIMGSKSRRKYYPEQMSEVQPRVLNLARTTSRNSRIPAVNLDITDILIHVKTNIEIHLPYDDGFFTSVRAAMDLSNIPAKTRLNLLSELRRILHRTGVLHLLLQDHHVSTQTIQQELPSAGFEYVRSGIPTNDLGNYFDFEESELSTNTTYIDASMHKIPHAIDLPLSEHNFRMLCRDFKAQFPHLKPVSYIITVYNEAKNLPHFLSFLDSVTDNTGAEREYIFVVNGCTDNSEAILREYADSSKKRVKVVESEPGILTAFKYGIRERELDGFVGRFDADIILHPYTLDLMQIHLTQNPNVEVTYAEPYPLESPSEFNAPYYHPELMSERLYFSGKTSLYRVNPHDHLGIKDMHPSLVTDDVFPSFYFAYYYGVDSISRTPHALVYERVIGNFDDLVKQMSRIDSELTRIYHEYPQFLAIAPVMVQEIYPGTYKDLCDRAADKITYSDHWLRLESTK